MDFTRMDEGAIRKRLAERDVLSIPELVSVSRLASFRGGGMFHSYNFMVEGDTVPYITKFVSHEQPLGHCLLLELAVARLAHLFSPPLSAKYAVLDIKPEHVSGVTCQGGCGRQLEPGHAFACRELPGVIEYRGGNPSISLASHHAARIVGFQTWLEGGDTQMLICVDDQSGFSMDHAAYLAGAANWTLGGTAVPAVTAVCINGLEANGRLQGSGTFDHFLHQLRQIPDERIVDAFGCIPAAWWGASDVDARVKLAGYTLARRHLVGPALHAFEGSV